MRAGAYANKRVCEPLPEERVSLGSPGGAPRRSSRGHRVPWGRRQAGRLDPRLQEPLCPDERSLRGTHGENRPGGLVLTDPWGRGLRRRRCGACSASGWGAECALRLRTRPAALREGAAAANQDKGHACAESKMREHGPPGAAMGYGHQTRGLWPSGCLGHLGTWKPGCLRLLSTWTPGTAGGAPGAGEFREGVA